MNINLYPNPANSYLTLQADVNEELEFGIYDMTGKLIETGSFTMLKTIDVSNFKNSVYFIKISNSENQLIKKFIVEN